MNKGFSSIRAKGRGDTYQASYHELCHNKELKHGITLHAEQIQYSDVELHLKFDRVHRILQLVVLPRLLVHNMLRRLVLLLHNRGMLHLIVDEKEKTHITRRKLVLCRIPSKSLKWSRYVLRGVEVELLNY